MGWLVCYKTEISVPHFNRFQIYLVGYRDPVSPLELHQHFPASEVAKRLINAAARDL